MTIYTHNDSHMSDCECSYCQDVNPIKSISFELEKYCAELVEYACINLCEDQSKIINDLTCKILLLRRYFPIKELPSKHNRLIEKFFENKSFK